MPSAFVAGSLAGWAIAVPVGAIGLLIIDLGIRRGFVAAAAAGAGAATVDGLYATLAMVGGVALAGAIEPIERPLRVAAVVVLLAIAARGLSLAVRERRRGRDQDRPSGPRTRPGASAAATYLRFVGLTLLNPATVIYFTALILTLPGTGRSSGDGAAFVLGAFLASLSWQVALAAASALAHRRLPPQLRIGVSVVGNLGIAAFALAIAVHV